MSGAALYSNSTSNLPGTQLLALTSTGTGVATSSSSYTLTQGTTYWIVWSNTGGGGSNIPQSLTTPTGSLATNYGSRAQFSGTWYEWPFFPRGAYASG